MKTINYWHNNLLIFSATVYSSLEITDIEPNRIATIRGKEYAIKSIDHNPLPGTNCEIITVKLQPLIARIPLQTIHNGHIIDVHFGLPQEN